MFWEAFPLSLDIPLQSDRFLYSGHAYEVESKDKTSDRFLKKWKDEISLSLLNLHQNRPSLHDNCVHHLPTMDLKYHLQETRFLFVEILNLLMIDKKRLHRGEIYS